MKKESKLTSRRCGGNGSSIVLRDTIVLNEKVKKSEQPQGDNAAFEPKSRFEQSKGNRAAGIPAAGNGINYRMMLDKHRFIGAYEKMKSDPGNMTPGTDNMTLDGISEKRIDSIIDSLKDRSFQFKPSKRTYIPKANGKLRPLGIPSPMDKLVQKVLYDILEREYEPIFLPSSHGFRPGRSCHTAIKEVYK